MHSGPIPPAQTPLEYIAPEPENTAPDGTPITYVSTQLVLDDTVKAAIKARMGTRAKKKTILGNTFVFLCANRAEWEENVDAWRSRKESEGIEITEEMFDKNLIDAFVIFPSVGMPFNLPAQDVAYWNSLPAGVQPQLAALIRHHAGFLVPELLKEEELGAEDLFSDDDIPERPEDEVITQAKEATDMPCRLVRFFKDWYIVRAMRWSEARYTRRRVLEDPNGDHEIRQLQSCIVYGPKDFDKKPAGLVPMLLAHMRQVSGLPLGDEPILHEEAEDL